MSIFLILELFLVRWRKKEIDEVDAPVLTIRLSFTDNYQNVLTEIVRQVGDDSKTLGSK